MIMLVKIFAIQDIVINFINIAFQLYYKVL